MDKRDAVALLGVACILAGLSLISPPLVLVAVGVGLVYKVSTWAG